MRQVSLLAAIGASVLLSAPGAHAQAYRGNDTSGIIPWSRGNELAARALADAHCAGYGKFARITSVVRQDGHYIGFNCLWNPRISRYVIPPVAIRSARHATVVGTYSPGPRSRNRLPPPESSD